jgi:hypothetical protein
VAAEGGGTWAPHHADLTASQVEEARALGLLVLPWTVNEADDMRRLLNADVDGLITDRPDIARKVLAAEGIELPHPRPAISTGSKGLLINNRIGVAYLPIWDSQVDSALIESGRD